MSCVCFLWDKPGREGLSVSVVSTGSGCPSVVSSGDRCDGPVTLTFHFHALEKEMAAHSSVLAWRIPGTGEPAGLPSMGSQRVGHD